MIETVDFLFFFVTCQIVLALMLLCNLSCCTYTHYLLFYVTNLRSVLLRLWLTLSLFLCILYIISRCRCLCFLWILQTPRGKSFVAILLRKHEKTYVYNPAEENCNLYNYKNEWGDRGVDYNYIITPIMITHYYYSHDTV